MGVRVITIIHGYRYIVEETPLDVEEDTLCINCQCSFVEHVDYGCLFASDKFQAIRHILCHKLMKIYDETLMVCRCWHTLR